MKQFSKGSKNDGKEVLESEARETSESEFPSNRERGLDENERQAFIQKMKDQFKSMKPISPFETPEDILRMLCPPDKD